MASSYPIFVGPNGSDPAKHILNLATAIQPTVGDALYGGQIIRSRIIARTASGVDAQGVSFAPYSEGYRRRKLGSLGHADTVDLFGPEAHVHMLNTLLVKAPGGELSAGQDAASDAFSLPQSTDLFEVGFYGTEAVRAQVHNEGASVRTRKGTGIKKSQKPSESSKNSFNMPRRHFFDANTQDIQLVEAAIGERMMKRAEAQK